MVYIKVIVPLLILALQVIMKFVVGRKIEKKNYLELLYELPTNFIFLAVSFSLVFMFLHESIRPEVVILFIIFIITALIVISIFRECKDLNDAARTKSKTAILVLIIIINYLISIGCLYIAAGQIMNNKSFIPQTTKTEKK